MLDRILVYINFSVQRIKWITFDEIYSTLRCPRILAFKILKVVSKSHVNRRISTTLVNPMDIGRLGEVVTLEALGAKLNGSLLDMKKEAIYGTPEDIIKETFNQFDKLKIKLSEFIGKVDFIAKPIIKSSTVQNFRAQPDFLVISDRPYFIEVKNFKYSKHYIIIIDIEVYNVCLD